MINKGKDVYGTKKHCAEKSMRVEGSGQISGNKMKIIVSQIADFHRGCTEKDLWKTIFQNLKENTCKKSFLVKFKI